MSESIVWGVDVSTTRVAFASTNGRTLSAEISKLDGAARLAQAREEATYAARSFTVPDNDPLCVWVEQPTGKHPKPTLVQMVGVVSEAIYAALSTLYAHPVTIYPIAVASWKKAALGFGNADKDDVMAWAQMLWDPANQDEADALAIAFAGQSMIRSEAA